MPDALNGIVAELGAEVRLLRIAMQQRVRWLTFTIAAVVLVGAAAFGGAYYLIQQNNRKFCAVVAASTDPAQPPPTTAWGKAQLDNFRDLGRSLRCPDPGLTG